MTRTVASTAVREESVTAWGSVLITAGQLSLCIICHHHVYMDLCTGYRVSPQDTARCHCGHNLKELVVIPKTPMEDMSEIKIKQRECTRFFLFGFGIWGKY